MQDELLDKHNTVDEGKREHGVTQKEKKKKSGSTNPACKGHDFLLPSAQTRGQRQLLESDGGNLFPCGIVPQRSPRCAQLLRNGVAIEMIHEDLHPRRATEIGQLGNFAAHPSLSAPLNGF